MMTKIYKTILKTNNNVYNYSLGETVNIQVLIIDYNNDPVVGEAVTVIIKTQEGTELLNDTYVTNTQGVINIPYIHQHPDVLIVSCNDKSIRLIYDGWYQVPESEWKDTSLTQNAAIVVRVYYNLRYIRVHVDSSKGSGGKITVSSTTNNLARMVSKFRPLMPVPVRLVWGYSNYLFCTDGGNIGLRTKNSGSGNVTVNHEIYYPRSRF